MNEMNSETQTALWWIMNDPATRNRIFESAKEIYSQAKEDSFSKQDNAWITLAKYLRSYFRENNPLVGDASIYSELLNIAITSIDYFRISEFIIKKIEE